MAAIAGVCCSDLFCPWCGRGVLNVTSYYPEPIALDYYRAPMLGGRGAISIVRSVGWGGEARHAADRQPPRPPPALWLLRRPTRREARRQSHAVRVLGGPRRRPAAVG
jgi:hypothetical protein